MKEIILNPAKSLSSGGSAAHKIFEKLEIPITIEPNVAQSQDEQRADIPFMEFQVNQMLMNSTCQVSFNYCYGGTQLIVAMYGPSEAKGFKQDPAKAFIELTLKDTITKETQFGVSEGSSYNLESLRTELKSILEQIIHLSAYPRTVITFQIFVVKNETDAQLFSACANGLFAVLNQSGLQMKVAPAAVLTLAVKVNDMTDDEELNIEIEENPKTLKEVSSYTVIDLVVHQHRDILYMKSQNEAFDWTSSLLGNEKALKLFEEIIESKSKQIFEGLTATL